MNRPHHNGRALGGQVERVPEIFDGELISDAEYARLKGWNLLPILAVAGVLRGSDHPRKITTAVLLRVARAARSVARALYTVGQGHASWARRAVDALTYGPVREQIRLAQLAGDREALAEWTERLVTLKDGRAERLQALPATLAAGLRTLFMVACVLGGLLLVIGLWLAFTPGSMGWSGWWLLVRQILNGTLATFSVACARSCGPRRLWCWWRRGGKDAAPQRRPGGCFPRRSAPRPMPRSLLM
jgi:hypothetical protein